jgi:hypothetical protein
MLFNDKLVSFFIFIFIICYFIIIFYISKSSLIESVRRP